MGKIVIDDGKEEYTIEDKHGNVLGSFRMNASDLGMIKRYEDLANDISSISDGIDSTADSVEILTAIEQKLYAAVDKFFGSSVSADIFGITSPFTPLANGDLFYENVLSAICTLIEQETGEKLKRVNAKVAKYATKYNG